MQRLGKKTDILTIKKYGDGLKVPFSAKPMDAELDT
jgi:hypothetical protein